MGNVALILDGKDRLGLACAVALRTKGCLTRPGMSRPLEKLYVRPPSSDQTGTSPRYGFRAAQKTILPPYLPLTGRMTSPCPEVGARHDVCEAPAADSCFCTSTNLPQVRPPSVLETCSNPPSCSALLSHPPGFSAVSLVNMSRIVFVRGS